MDAADDYAEDRKRHRYNPYIGLFGSEGPDMTDGNRRAIELSLTEILSDTERAFLLFPEPPCAEVREIVSNILYLGMPRTAQRVLFPSHATKKETDHE